jgi:secreted PhoX family phosphatase
MKDNDSKYDKGGYNRIRVEANSCGCVYQLELNSFNIATNMSATICGIMNPDKTCNVNVMAEPDNIVYNAKYDVLVIAEDSHGHENNYCWLYKPETGELQRMLTGPVGSEITSAGFVEIDSCFYVKAVVSHPYEGIIGPYADPDLNPYYSGSSAYLGVIGIKPEKACSSVSPDDISSSSSSNNDEIHSYKIGIIVLSVLLFLIIVIFALFYWKQTKDKRTNSLLNGSLM